MHILLRIWWLSRTVDDVRGMTQESICFHIVAPSSQQMASNRKRDLHVHDSEIDPNLAFKKILIHLEKYTRTVILGFFPPKVMDLWVAFTFFFVLYFQNFLNKSVEVYYSEKKNLIGGGERGRVQWKSTTFWKAEAA